MSQKPVGTPGIGGDGKAVVNNSGRLELLADRIDVGELHDKADGFIRANDFVTHARADGQLHDDMCLQAIEEGVALGVRLAVKANGKPIQMVTANDAYGLCRFYFIGTTDEVAKRLKKMIA